MFKLPMALLPLLFSCTAVAEWKQIVTTYNPTAYADPATLQRSGDLASMWVLIDFKKPPFDGNNLPYRSLKMHVEYNCATIEFRFLELASFEGQMATGRTPYTSIEPGAWQPATPEGIQRPLWETACQR